MKSSPLPYSSGAPGSHRAAGRVTWISLAIGLGAAVFGVVLALATLAALVRGSAAVGFFDLAVGSMYLAFGWYAAKFGYKVATGRQTLAGRAIAG